MKVKHIIPSLLISTLPFTTTCTKYGTKLSGDLNSNHKLTEIMQDSLSKNFSDQEKIIQFRKLLKQYQNPDTGNYIIVDKKKCTATVFNADGDSLETFEVAIGKQRSDKRGGGYKDPKIKLRANTTAGEFEISREGATSQNDKKLYGDRVLILRGDHTIEASKSKQTLALHRVPKTPMGKLRENVFNNKTLKDNRVSFGCVNFMADSFDKMRKLISGKGTKVYILPEEEGNSLRLEKIGENKYKFFQTKYRYEYQEKSK